MIFKSLFEQVLDLVIPFILMITRSRVSTTRGVFVKAHEQKNLRKSESFLRSTSVDDFDDAEADLDLFDIQDSTFNRSKPIKSVLTVQEKLAQDYPSLPPQAEVYMNLIEDDINDQQLSVYGERQDFSFHFP